MKRNRALAWVAAAALTAGAGIGASGAMGGPSEAPKGKPAAPTFAPIGTYATGITLGEDETSGETSAFAKGRLYVTNSTGNSLDVVDASDPKAPSLLRRVPLDAWGAGPNSVAVSHGLVAVAVESDPKTDPGNVVFFTPSGRYITHVEAGALPDMLTFTPDGRSVVVANEGEPTDYGPDGVDPEGTVTIIDVTKIGEKGRKKGGPRVRTVDFRAFNEGAPRHDELPDGIRLNGPGATVAQDVEPEYVTVSRDGKTAHVVLQEANSIAEIDLRTAKVTRIFALGWKDHSVPGAGLDASNDDGAINIATWPVRGLYMPDGMAAFRVRGRDYLITANEGDGRDYDSFSDETTVEDIDLDPAVFTGGLDQTLKQPENLGPLTITTDGLNETTGLYEAIYAYGARSASIWSARTGEQVWDSGDQMEQRVAAEQPDHFNANHTGNGFDNRSDNKGPEPEGVATGTIRGRTYAFVGLERIGGFMVFDVSDPEAPVLTQWANNRDYEADPVGPDSGPEIVSFVSAGDSPTRRPLVIVSNEITGTVTFYEGSR